MPPWNSAKAKVQLRLAVQRLRTLQEKKEAQAKVARRDIATLLEPQRNKIETARLKVESIINEDIYLELLELMELYCELLIARFGMLDQNTAQPDASVVEGVCGIIYAAPRTEVKELHVLRDLFMHKYGRDFSTAVTENRDGIVSERVTKKLVVITPPGELVDAYLGEIAKAYNVPWAPVRSDAGDAAEGRVRKISTDESGADSSLAEDSSSKTHAGGHAAKPGGQGETDAALASPDQSGSSVDGPVASDFDLLKKRFDALKKR